MKKLLKTKRGNIFVERKKMFEFIRILCVYMFQTIHVFGPYAYGPDPMRIFSKYLYGLPSFKRLSRLQKYFTG